MPVIDLATLVKRSQGRRTMKALALGMFVSAIALSGIGDAARAGEIKLLTAGAMRAVVATLLPDFEQQTGHKVTIDNATAGALAKRIEGGEAFDVAIITPAVVDDLASKGRIVPGSRIDLAKVGMGMAVKQGAAMPDIATVDAFKRTLLSVTSVAYVDPKAGGSSGIYFDKLLDRLGIGDAIRAKAKLKQGGYVAELVVSGEAEVAIHQISEIVPVRGAVLVGPLPAEIQNTTVYSAGLGVAAKDTAAAKALIQFIAGPASGAILKTKGMEKP
jgi:molybdate transport system substrate-binding protein